MINLARSGILLSLFCLVAHAESFTTCREPKDQSAFQFAVQDALTPGQAEFYAGYYDRDRGEFITAAILDTKVEHQEIKGDPLPHRYTHTAAVEGQKLSISIHLDAKKVSGRATLSWSPSTVMDCWYGDPNDPRKTWEE